MTNKDILNSTIIFFLIFLSIIPKLSHADIVAEQQNQQLRLYQIQSEISEFLEDKYAEIYDGRIHIAIPTLNTAFRLKPCENIEYFLPNHSNNSHRLTVGIQCNNPQSWTIYLPVTVKVYKPVVKTTTTLSKGTVLTLEDLALQETNIMHETQSFFNNLESVVGMVLKRPVRAGKVVTSNLIERPKIIKRGDILEIIVQTKGLLIKAKGIAQEDGSENESIKVKNMKSNRVIEALAVGPGIVKVII